MRDEISIVTFTVNGARINPAFTIKIAAPLSLKQTKLLLG